MENLFEKGCLVQLSASVWGATRKIKPEQLTDLTVSSEWLRASKKLVDPEALKPIAKVINQARSYVTGVSLPFPIKGMEFVPKEMITRVDGRLTGFKADFNREVETFVKSYDRLGATIIIGCFVGGNVLSQFFYGTGNDRWHIFMMAPLY